MIFSLYPNFRKPGKWQDLMDVMVQVQTIQFTVFRWTIWFIRTLQVGTLSLFFMYFTSVPLLQSSISFTEQIEVHINNIGWPL